MLNKQFKQFVTVLLMLSALALAAPAADGREKRPDSPSKNFQPFKELNLTADQTKQLEASRKASEKVMKVNRDELQKEHKNLREELFKDNTDMAKVEASKKTILTYESKQLDGMVQNTLELKKILNKEQLAKLREQQDKHFQGAKKDFKPDGERRPKEDRR